VSAGVVVFVVLGSRPDEPVAEKKTPASQEDEDFVPPMPLSPRPGEGTKKTAPETPATAAPKAEIPKAGEPATPASKENPENPKVPAAPAQEIPGRQAPTIQLPSEKGPKALTPEGQPTPPTRTVEEMPTGRVGTMM